MKLLCNRVYHSRVSTPFSVKMRMHFVLHAVINSEHTYTIHTHAHISLSFFFQFTILMAPINWLIFMHFISFPRAHYVSYFSLQFVIQKKKIRIHFPVKTIIMITNRVLRPLCLLCTTIKFMELKIDFWSSKKLFIFINH